MKARLHIFYMNTSTFFLGFLRNFEINFPCRGIFLVFYIQMKSELLFLSYILYCVCSIPVKRICGIVLLLMTLNDEVFTAMNHV